MNDNNKQETSKEKLNERQDVTNIDDDVLVVNDWGELGEFVTAEDYCKRLDEILNGR